MLKQEQNDLVTQTGPGTPMGNLFRRYWLPALLAEEVAEPDGAPVRLQLLSERMLAFRDSQGRLGAIDEFCAHRGVSLWFGRNEESGLRCPYHGWKYDVKGRCVEVPSEPAESGYCDKIRLKSYPLVERGGVIWIYMGPPELQPPLPEWEFATVPANQSFMSKRLQECNWLQALEGGIDSSHVSFLHSGQLNNDPLFKGAGGNKYNVADKKPVFEVVPADGGLFIGARRLAEDDQYYWRITPWIMPCFTMVPPRGDHPVHGHFWVPIDDHNNWAWSFDYHPTRALRDSERQAMKDGQGIHVKYVPGTYVPLANKSNDYLMNRAAQKAGLQYSGIEGIGMQDASLQESMGWVQDRTKEHLVSTDNGIIMMRQRIMKAAKALAEKGEPPPGSSPEHQHVRSAAVLLKRDQAFKDAAREALQSAPGKAHASV
jgi:phthalate 4,5-dioxygenase oxygenase subunit